MSAFQTRPIILCGGAGTRLWPLSSPQCPKVFLRPQGNSSLLQATLARFNRPGFLPPILLGRAADRSLIEQEIAQSDCPPAALVLEPVRRNTAASVATALALPLVRKTPDSVLLFAPADHVIENETKFLSACRQAAEIASMGYLALLGILCTHASTQYGYIKRGCSLAGGLAYKVDAFIEKPNREKARYYAAMKTYYWNSGLFFTQPNSLKKELARHAPTGLLEGAQKAVAAGARDKTKSGVPIFMPDPLCFASLPATSIDYALLEKSREVAMIPADMGWLDVGNWDSLYHLLPHDDQANAAPHIAHGKTRFANASGNFVWSEDRQVVLEGVEDLVVIATADRILITRRKSEAARMAASSIAQSGGWGNE